MGQEPLILETGRLQLRRLQSSDVDALVALWRDPDVTRFMGGPRDEEKLRPGLIEDSADPFATTYDLWPVIEKSSGTVIGHCGLTDKEVDGREEIELVYVLAKRAWGKGYATEIAHALRDHAFGPMGLSRLISLIEPENAASERVAAKVGMTMEKEVVRPGGALRRVYTIEREPVETIPSPRVSARALIVKDDRVLVSCYVDERGPWYVLPGGGQRSGETLTTCLVREVKEETSAEVSIGRLRWVREFISANHEESTLDPSFHQIELIFECELVDGAEVAMGAVPDIGQTGLCWYTIPELRDVRFYPEPVASILNGEREDRLYLGDV
ncbi:GNAT family N-acetyltransferase [Candidatus Bipolaricaulota bacterium]|nr:GNAT family N-acetyltransferase [Candidatus Bipolaricaulota bacterium]